MKKIEFELSEKIKEKIVETTIKKQIRRHMRSFFKYECDLYGMTEEILRKEIKDALSTRYNDVIDSVDKKDVAADLAVHIYDRLFNGKE